MDDAVPPVDPPDARRFPWLGSALWLAAAMAMPKALLLLPVTAPAADGTPPPRHWLGDLQAATSQDVTLALALGTAAWLAGLSVRRWPRVRRLVWGCWLAVASLCATYAVANFWICRVTGGPLTYYTSYLAGDARFLGSSIRAYVSPAVVLSLAAAAPLYLLTVYATARFRPALRPPRRRAIAGGAIAFAVVWAVLGAMRPAPALDVDATSSPLWALGRSYAMEWLANSTESPIPMPSAATTEAAAVEARPDLLPPDFPPEDAADFLPAGDRPAATSTTRRSPTTAPIPLPRAAHRRPRNLIFIVLESVGAEYLSLYGSPYATTPNLQAEAARDGLVIDGFYCDVGRTDGSMATLVRSQYVPITWRVLLAAEPHVPGRSLADVLKARGYRTAFFSSADLSFQNMSGFLAHRGFDEVGDVASLAPDDHSNSWGTFDQPLFARMTAWLDERAGGAATAATAATQTAPRPFFLMAWTSQTHHPYALQDKEHVLPLYTGGSIPGGANSFNRYLNSVREVDALLGRLFDALRQRHLADDTLVVITGDHGEAFGVPHPFNIGHGWQLYDEGIRVPCVFWNPATFGSPAAPHRARAIASHIDLSRSILDLLDGPATHASEHTRSDIPPTWQGHSLFSPDHPGRAYFFAANRDLILGVRERDLKYLANLSAGTEALYDLRADPVEQHDLAPSHPADARRLRQHLAAWFAHEQRQYLDFYRQWDCFSVPGWARPRRALLLRPPLSR